MSMTADGVNTILVGFCYILSRTMKGLIDMLVSASGSFSEVMTTRAEGEIYCESTLYNQVL